MQRLAIAPEQLHNQVISLTPQQQHYLGRVLRLQAGDRFIAMNGRGNWWLAKLQDTATAEILEPLQVKTELPVEVTLILALPKNGFDDVVRGCTELGVNRIVPVISDRTLLKPSPQKLERWRRIATEASEQSERQIVPEILDPVPFAASLSVIAEGKYMGWARGDLPHLLAQYELSYSSVAIAIGPEGGWTQAEIANAIASGFQPVTLGNRILRAITAPLVALSLVAGAIESCQNKNRN